MIRLTVLALFVCFFSAYAFKNWFRSLCALIFMMGFIEHPDVPKTMLGIQGLNPWNILMLFVLAGWFVSRKEEERPVDLLPGLKLLLAIYVSFFFISTLRLLSNFEVFSRLNAIISVYEETPVSIISEYIINSVKWLFPAYLLFKGCNSRERLYWAVGAISAVYLLLAIQVIKWMPFSNLTSGDALSDRSLKILVNEVGLHRVNLSMLLAGGSWAIFCTRLWFKKKFHILIILSLSLMCLIAVALTGGRTGYVTWGVVGLAIAFIKWKKYIALIPIPVLIMYLLLPQAFDRLTQGLDSDEEGIANKRLEERMYLTANDRVLYSLTSGRSVAWPFVIEKIGERPILGYGRRGMVTAGVAPYLLTELGEPFPHPHNAYLQFALDNGLIGLLVVLLFYSIMVKRSISLIKDTEDIDNQVIGGVCLSLLLAFLFASIGSQTFYPREGAVGMWCAMALMTRLWLVRRAKKVKKSDVFGEEISPLSDGNDFVWNSK